jgi:hypothetical protein
MPCIKGYRVGPPRITETMAQQGGGRGTGYLGTGVYFYRTPEGMVKDRAFKEGMPGYEMDCPLKKPFLLRDDNDWVWRFHDFSRDMVRNIRYKEEFKPEVHTWYAEIPLFDNGINLKSDELKRRVNDAMEKTKYCLANRKDDAWGYSCDQPINHFLGDLGFDGVMAKGEYGDRNDLGCVIFRKPLERCTARPFDAEQQGMKRDRMVKEVQSDGSVHWVQQPMKMLHLVRGTEEFAKYEKKRGQQFGNEMWVEEPKDYSDLDLSMLTRDFVQCVGGATQIVCDEKVGACSELDRYVESIGGRTRVHRKRDE